MPGRSLSWPGILFGQASKSNRHFLRGSPERGPVRHPLSCVKRDARYPNPRLELNGQQVDDNHGEFWSDVSRTALESGGEPVLPAIATRRPGHQTSMFAGRLFEIALQIVGKTPARKPCERFTNGKCEIFQIVRIIPEARASHWPNGSVPRLIRDAR